MSSESKAERVRAALIELHGDEIGATLFDLWALNEGAAQRRSEELWKSLRWRYAGEGPEPPREIVNRTIVHNLNWQYQGPGAPPPREIWNVPASTPG